MHRQFIRITILFFVLAGYSHAESTQGRLFLQSFTPDVYVSSDQNWEITQGPDGIIYVANNPALLSFDGVRWHAYFHPDRHKPISIDVSEDGRVYVGFRGDFGYLDADSTAQLRVVSLTHLLPDSLQDVSNIWDTRATPNGVFFRSSTRVYRYLPDTEPGGKHHDMGF